jgi:hypothetical protein
MTLANMRAQGVCSLWVVCDLCHHGAVLNVDRFDDDVPVRSARAWSDAVVAEGQHPNFL